MLLVLGDSIPGQFSKVTKLGGLPNHAHEPKKLVPLGEMLKNEVECGSGIIVRSGVAQTPEK